MDELYYIFGDYLYNLVQPKISGDIDIFKYILGKIYLEYIIENSVSNVNMLES